MELEAINKRASVKIHNLDTIFDYVQKMKLFCVCLLFAISWHAGNSALLFTTNSEYGIFMAISVPISLPHRNVFVSYNYEFNYYQPEHVYKYPPILMGDGFEDSYLTYGTTGRQVAGRKCHNCTDNARLTNATKADVVSETRETSSVTRQKRSTSLMSRTTFYTMLRDKLDRTGYPGEACLLRLICETNASTLGEHNGFLGSIVHIIFTPSSSQDEHLPDEYYQAEVQGRLEKCDMYASDCRENILDLISSPVGEILNDITSRRL